MRLHKELTSETIRTRPIRLSYPPLHDGARKRSMTPCSVRSDAPAIRLAEICTPPLLTFARSVALSQCQQRALSVEHSEGSSPAVHPA